MSRRATGLTGVLSVYGRSRRSGTVAGLPGPWLPGQERGPKLPQRGTCPQIGPRWLTPGLVRITGRPVGQRSADGLDELR